MALKKVRLIHPITHDGVEYSRGIHELDETIVDHFVTNIPHAAKDFEEKNPEMGTTKVASDAPKEKQLPPQVQKQLEQQPAPPDTGAAGTTKSAVDAPKTNGKK